MSKNKTYATLNKVFQDSEGHRVKAIVVHGTTHAAFGNGKTEDLQTTWVEIAILPKEGQDASKFMTEIGMSKKYKKAIGIKLFQANCKREVDADINKNGATLSSYTSITSGMGRSKEDTAEEVGRVLETRKLTDPDFKRQITEFIMEAASNEKWEEAKSAFQRTGGQNTSEIGK